MAIYSNNSSGSTGGFEKVGGGFGSLGGFQGFGSSGDDTLSSQELLMMAKMNGGSLAQVAEELTHPERSILSTIGQGFKKAFQGFVDVISTPSEIVAGLISPDFTVKEAIEQNKRVSDAIFGDTNIFNKDGEPTTLQKIGNFLVRTPLDILSDPLTYLTFGTSAGVMGIKSLPKVTLYDDAIKAAGLTGKAAKQGGVVTRAVTSEGDEMLKYLRNVERQASGKIGLEKLAAQRQGLLAKGVTEETIDFSEKELKRLLADTVEAPLKQDFAKATMSKLLANNPALVDTMIDKGGIKYFGKTILSGQRVGAVSALIPGMTMVDNATLGVRNSVAALFDTGLVKSADGYIRLPEEYVGFKNQLKDLSTSMKTDMFRNLSNVQNELNLTSDEWRLVMDSMSIRKIPADERLANAYMKMIDVDEKNLSMLKKAGVQIHNMENHTGLVYVPEDTRAFMKTNQFSKEIGSAKVASYAKFIEQVDGAGLSISQNVPQVKSFVEANKIPNLSKEITEAGSAQDVGFAIGRATDAKIQELTQNGMSFADALKDGDVKELLELRKSVDTIPQATQKVGKPEALSLSYKQSAQEMKAITDELTETWNKLGIKKQAFEEDIVKLSSSIDDVMNARLTGELKGMVGSTLNNLPSGSRKNAEIIMKRIEEYVGRADINKLKATVKPRGAQEIVESITSKGIKELDEKAAKKIVGKILQDEKMVQVDLEELNKIIKSQLEKKTAVKKGGTEVVEELSEEQASKIAKLYNESEAARYALARRDLDENALTKLVDVVKKEWEADPKGVKQLLRSLVGSENKLNQTIEAMDLAKMEANKKLSAIPRNLDSYFVYAEGKVEKVFKRVAAAATELEDAGFKGFDTNLLTAYASRSLQNQKQALGQHFMEGMIRNFSRKSTEASPDWLPITNSALLEKGKSIGMPLLADNGDELVFHPAIAKSFEKMMEGISNDELTEGFWKNFDKLQRYWKASVTSIFPMFHGRNAISNVFLNMMDLGYEVFNPKTHAMSMDIVAKDRISSRLMKRMVGSGDDAVKASQEFSEMMGRNMFTDKSGYTWTYGELHKVIKDNGLAFTPNVTGATDIGDAGELSKFFGLDQSKRKQALQKLNPLNVEQNVIIKGGRELGSLIEEQARITNFITNLRNTGDVGHAVSRSKQFLFDYGNLTSFERNVLRRLIPFYSFTKFNLELQAKTLLSSPGRISSQIKAIQSIGDLIGGEQMTAEEQKLLPPWLANSINIKRKGKDGATEIISGFGTPIEQPFSAFQPNQFLGGISPLFRYPVEVMTGYQFFRGKATSEVIDASDFSKAPQAVKDFIGYSEYKGTTKDGKQFSRSVSLKPGNMNFIRNLPWAGRISNIFGQMTDKDTTADAKLLQSITGVQARAIDFEVEAERQERDLQLKLEGLMEDAGVRGSFTRYYTKKNTQQVQ